MSSKKKLKCRKVEAVLRYHHPSPPKYIEQYLHHLLLAFYPFRDEEHLKLPSKTGTYFTQFHQSGVMDRISGNKSVMEPFGEMVGQALLNLHTYVVNADAFPQQENDEVQAKLSATVRI